MVVIYVEDQMPARRTAGHPCRRGHRGNRNKACLYRLAVLSSGEDYCAAVSSVPPKKGGTSARGLENAGAFLHISTLRRLLVITHQDLHLRIVRTKEQSQRRA